MIRFETRARPTAFVSAAAPLGAVAAALLLATIPLAAAGAPIVRAFA
jgi:simple sugar transport system permease protein